MSETKADPQARTRLATVAEPTANTVQTLLALAPRGLAATYLPETGGFAQTVRGHADPEGVRLRREGVSIRYAAIAALGLSRLGIEEQRALLSGRTATEIAELAALRAGEAADPGAQALAAWALAEVSGAFDARLFGRLASAVTGPTPIATVCASWAVTAAVAARHLGDTAELLDAGVALLQTHQGSRGVFPPLLPPSAQSRLRRHVGSFADQVYPIQALARAGSALCRPELLTAANRTATTICRLQGDHGQWWWHYDSRTGDVVEPYPVYSVHQHAMAPMALFDLLGSGGDDHRGELERGVGWLRSHPEVVEELISERWGLVWRKVGRREPRKAARALQAAASSVRPHARVPGLDHLLPPRVVDHECRPYELGWLLYAWGGPEVTS